MSSALLKRANVIDFNVDFFDLEASGSLIFESLFDNKFDVLSTGIFERSHGSIFIANCVPQIRALHERIQY